MKILFFAVIICIQLLSLPPISLAKNKGLISLCFDVQSAKNEDDIRAIVGRFYTLGNDREGNFFCEGCFKLTQAVKPNNLIFSYLPDSDCSYSHRTDWGFISIQVSDELYKKISKSQRSLNGKVPLHYFNNIKDGDWFKTTRVIDILEVEMSNGSEVYIPVLKIQE